MKCERALEYQRDFYINAKMKVKKAKQKPIYSEMKRCNKGE
jgi:glutathione peroxidase-family protein